MPLRDAIPFRGTPAFTGSGDWTYENQLNRSRLSATLIRPKGAFPVGIPHRSIFVSAALSKLSLSAYQEEKESLMARASTNTGSRSTADNIKAEGPPPTKGLASAVLNMLEIRLPDQ